jgi:hypothetical protein
VAVTAPRHRVEVDLSRAPNLVADQRRAVAIEFSVDRRISDGGLDVARLRTLNDAADAPRAKAARRIGASGHALVSACDLRLAHLLAVRGAAVAGLAAAIADSDATAVTREPSRWERALERTSVRISVPAIEHEVANGPVVAAMKPNREDRNAFKGEVQPLGRGRWYAGAIVPSRCSMPGAR